MRIIYKLNKGLIGREANNLSYNLNLLKPTTSIFIRKTSNGRKINGKSLLGILSESFRPNDIIIIDIHPIDNSSEEREKEEIVEIFNQVGVLQEVET